MAVAVAPRGLRARPARRDVRPALRVVRPASRAHTAAIRRRRLVLGACTLAALSLFGVAAAHVVIAQSQFELARLERQSTDQQAQYDRLRLEVAELESPGRIVAAAQERLGMVPPPQPLQTTGSARHTGSGQATTAAAGPTEWSLLKPHLASR